MIFNLGNGPCFQFGNGKRNEADFFGKGFLSFTNGSGFAYNIHRVDVYFSDIDKYCTDLLLRKRDVLND